MILNLSQPRFRNAALTTAITRFRTHSGGGAVGPDDPQGVRTRT